MRKAYRHLEVGDYVEIKSARGPIAAATVAHVTTGDQVWVRRWSRRSGVWGKMERMEAVDYLRSIDKSEFIQRHLTNGG